MLIMIPMNVPHAAHVRRRNGSRGRAWSLRETLAPDIGRQGTIRLGRPARHVAGGAYGRSVLDFTTHHRPWFGRSRRTEIVRALRRLWDQGNRWLLRGSG